MVPEQGLLEVSRTVRKEGRVPRQPTRRLLTKGVWCEYGCKALCFPTDVRASTTVLRAPASFHGA